MIVNRFSNQSIEGDKNINNILSLTWNMLDHGIVAILVKNNKFLLLEDARELMLGRWSPPHGRCEPVDKSEEDTVIREVFEETNLKVKPIKKLFTSVADTKVKTVSFWLVKIIAGKIDVNKTETSNYGWFTLGESLRLNLYPGTKKFFDLIKKGEINVRDLE
jgi:ADP-ribose pyrophosphatase YjhB (NUDIX family)